MQNAELIAAQFEAFGWKTRIEKFPVLIAYPSTQQLKLLDAPDYEARFHEPAVEGDPDSGVTGALPGMEAYSPDGEAEGVKARLVVGDETVTNSESVVQPRPSTTFGRWNEVASTLSSWPTIWLC